MRAPASHWRAAVKPDSESAAEIVSTHPKWWTDLDSKAVDTARLLAADAVQTGRKRPSRHRDEPGSAGLPAVPEDSAARPDRPELGGSRPVRAVQRPLLADPLHPALPVRLRPAAGRPEVTAHLGLADPRPPGARPHHRGGDHHRPARPGRRQCGRDGDGGPPRTRPAGPGRSGRRIAVRPPHLRDRRRRLPGGGRVQRGQLAGRPPAAGQPHPHLRRQPHLDRGRHQRGVLARTCSSATRPTAGTPSTSNPARTWWRWRRRSSPPRPRPPGRPSSRCAPSSAGRRRPSRTPARRTARRSARTRSARPRNCSASTRTCTSRRTTR